jgi:hypothetical protein
LTTVDLTVHRKAAVAVEGHLVTILVEPPPPFFDPGIGHDREHVVITAHRLALTGASDSPGKDAAWCAPDREVAAFRSNTSICGEAFCARVGDLVKSLQDGEVGERICLGVAPV